MGHHDNLPFNPPDRRVRTSARLQHYDYSEPGAYFVTICVANRVCLLGHIIDGYACLNNIGHMVARTWAELPRNYPGVETDAFIVMPNHMHGILILTACDDQPDRVGVGTDPYIQNEPHSPMATPRPTLTPRLPELIRRFKTLTTRRCTEFAAAETLRSTKGRLWQRNYYEHVIRNERSLEHIRDYIIGNPGRWDLDEENPSHHPPNPL